MVDAVRPLPARLFNYSVCANTKKFFLCNCVDNFFIKKYLEKKMYTRGRRGRTPTNIFVSAVADHVCTFVRESISEH